MNASPDKLRVAIVGLGFMGRTHLKRLSERGDVAVVALCDAKPERCAADAPTGNLDAGGAASLPAGARFTTSFAEVMAADDVDAVVAAVPTSLHAELTCAALDAGKHVFCEKPMALTLAECDAMLAAARRSGCTLMIGQCIRFWPQYELIKRTLDEGRLGAVRCVHLRRVSSPPGFGADNWFMDARLSGGALLDLHVHDVDFARHLLGPPERLSAVGGPGPSGGIDHVFASWRYADGRYAAIEGGWSFTAPFPFNMSIAVQAERGTLVWDMQAGPNVRLYQGGDEPEILHADPGDGWSRELDYFVRSVRSAAGVERCPPTESRAAVALALHEQEAVSTGATISVAEG